METPNILAIYCRSTFWSLPLQISLMILCCSVTGTVRHSSRFWDVCLCSLLPLLGFYLVKLSGHRFLQRQVGRELQKLLPNLTLWDMLYVVLKITLLSYSAPAGQGCSSLFLSFVSCWIHRNEEENREVGVYMEVESDCRVCAVGHMIFPDLFPDVEFFLTKLFDYRMTFSSWDKLHF